MTIVLTTHYLDEADSMAGRVVVVDHGEVIADDTAEALKADLAGDRIEVTVDTPLTGDDRVGELARLVGRLPGARELAVDAGLVTARVGRRTRARCPELLSARRPGRGRRWQGPAAPADAGRRVPHPDRPQPARGRVGTHRRRQIEPEKAAA